MKTPELPTKIYFTILDMGSGYVYTPSLDDNGGTEYIRKDALLEWAKDWQNELDDSLGASMVHHVLNEVIKKIESL